MTLLKPAAIDFNQVDLERDISLALAGWWENSAEANPSLFNGPLVGCNLSALDDDGIVTLEWYKTSYAHYLQRKAHAPVTEPASALFCAVALLSWTGDLVIGQMSETTSSPFRLQLPGGNITPPNRDELSLAHCISNACEEVEEEVGLSLDPSALRLWRVKMGGSHNDIGIMFECQLKLTNDEISDVFEQHKQALYSKSEIPELDRLWLEEPANLRLDAFECVDYLQSVVLALTDERD